MTKRFEHEYIVFCMVKRSILIDKQDIITVEGLHSKYGFQNMPDGTRKQMIGETVMARCLRALSKPHIAALERDQINRNSRKGYRYRYNDTAAKLYFSQPRKLSRSTAYSRLFDMVCDMWLTHPAEGIYRWNTDRVFEIEGFESALDAHLKILSKATGRRVSLEEFKKLIPQPLTTEELIRFQRESKIYLSTEKN